MAEDREPWGQLVSTTEVESEPVMMRSLKFSIGRSPACDLSFNGMKLVSAKHCIMERDAEGRTWVEDKSTNGTLLNLTGKILKTRVEIRHGDEIHIVYRKNSPETNIAFVFQDTAKLRLEMSESTVEYVPSENDIPTSEYADEGDGEEEIPVDEQDAAPDGSPPPAAKSQVSGTVLHQKRKRTESSTSEQLPSKKVCAKKADTPSKMADHTNEDESPAKDKTKSVKDDPKEGTSKPTKKDETMDEIQESLTCIICQEIFHNCIGLQPCMHSFCAGCYSDWMPQSDECPSCRGKVTRINKNHLVNNLVEAFLKSHPDKVRPQEDIDEQNKKNKITKDMLYPKKQLRRRSDSDFSGDEDEGSRSSSHNGSDHSSDEDYHTGTGENPFRNVIDHVEPAPRPRVILQGRVAPRAMVGPIFFGGLTVPPTLQTVCRQCPGYTGLQPTGRLDGPKPKGARLFTGLGTNTSATASNTTTGAGPTAGPSGVGPGSTVVTATSLPDVKIMPPVPDYTCTPDQTHALCRCCLQPMPKRDLDTNPNIGPISCVICYQQYCHAYWGCYQKCGGCFGRFKDMNFGKDCLRHIILDNIYESSVLENYMKMKNMSVRDLLAVCMTRLQEGTYTTFDQLWNSSLNPDSPICSVCGLRNLKHLAYQYRQDIPNNELPLGVTSRPDCHWGKNCRTQCNKPHHAMHFNHVCEQTKTS